MLVDHLPVSVVLYSQISQTSPPVPNGGETTFTTHSLKNREAEQNFFRYLCVKGYKLTHMAYRFTGCVPVSRDSFTVVVFIGQLCVCADGISDDQVV